MAFEQQNMQMGQTVRRTYGYAGEAVDQTTTLENILAALTNVSFLPANSASQTVMIIGTLASDPKISIFLKIFDGLEPSMEGDIPYETLNLRAEYKIYSELYKLRHLRLTPNVLARVGTYRLLPTHETTFLEDPALKAIPNYQGYFYTGLKGNKGRLDISELPQIQTWEATMCIMSCSVEYSLLECLTEFRGAKTPSFEDLVGMLYQIMHLLTWFEHIQMTHHDLHAGNIRVEYHAEPIDLYYQHREGRCVHVRTKYVIKLYDFDRSTIYKQTDLGGGMVVQPVYNFGTGFGVFNAKEDAFKIIILFLKSKSYIPKYKELIGKILPGLDPRLPAAQVKIDDLYKDLPPAEKPLYDAIMNNSMCVGAKYATLRALTLNTSFAAYFSKINKHQVISIPAHDDWSLCSIYLPNSIMLPHLDILDVLSASFTVTLEEARASGQPLYATPNVYYKVRTRREVAPTRLVGNTRKRRADNANEDAGTFKRLRTALSWLPSMLPAIPAIPAFLPALPQILPLGWWKQEANRSQNHWDNPGMSNMYQEDDDEGREEWMRRMNTNA